ncbi:MAG TPA: chorismate-binding protein [Mycobacteriales bacterium]|nr:chorismate-binding protein [Mycobacteriales bacterium]
MTLNLNDGHLFGGTGADVFPGRPAPWRGPLVEVDRLETDDPQDVLAFVDALGLGGPPDSHRGELAVGLLLGARGCAVLGDVPRPQASPVAKIPECVAVVYRRGEARATPLGTASTGPWRTTWTDEEHAAAVQAVREAIERGEVYQANVVGHRSAPCSGDPRALAAAVAQLPGATYGGVVSGEGWVVASASPEQLVRVEGVTLSTVPIKGTAAARDVLQASAKDRAEHVMIVDLERNDVARVAQTGSVAVEDLYALSQWSGLWHASSTVTGRLAPGAGTVDVLAALLPGGSVTGAPKHAACALLAALEPVGRGPAMGAMGFLWPGGLDLGLTIRTVAIVDGRVHLWAGGGITWGSDPATEVAEAHAKAAPVQAALAQVRPASS